MMDDSRIIVTPRVSIPLNEIEFRTSRSGGPGGQNVNKLETKVELVFSIANSKSLDEEQKRTLFSAFRTRIDRDGALRISSQRSRSQWENKQDVIDRFARLLREALKPRKKRAKSTPTATSREKRIRGKKKTGEKKKLRRLNLEHEQ